jgi:D-alanyl-D-alanine carboxypeptidase
MNKSERDDNIYDPYAADDPNVGEVHYGSPDEFHDARQPDASAFRDNDEKPAVPKRGGGKHDAPRLGKERRIAIDGAADEDFSDRRSAIGELDETGGKAISERQLRRRVQSRSRRARRKFNPAILIMVLAYVLVIGGCVFYIVIGRNRHANVDVETEPEVVVTPESASEKQIAAPDGFSSVEVQTKSMRAGDLILVNYAYAYEFPEEADTVSVYDFKTKSYKVRDTAVSLSKAVVGKFNKLMDDFAAATGCADMMVVSGFRDFEFQNEIFVDRVQTDGEEEAAKYVAVPGYSEHHTGLAMDLSVYLADGRTVYVEDYEPCDWFEEHAPEYGFVLRYPSVKAATTHISYESWHYRYVGVPHAEIMYEKDLCLEEYIDFLRAYRCGEKYLCFRKGSSFESETLPTDADYAVYYVPAFDGEKTLIPVPEGADYEISGNNVDGFVVTLILK